MILDLDLIFASKIIAKMEPKKPKALLKKYFQMWWKMTILLYKIFILSRKCSKYPDLKKYRGNPKRKQKVWAKRDKLTELKRELSNILKS